MIFDIKRYAINDGPGIRVTVFLKGCPLHCSWCANPESQNIKPQLEWDKRHCLHCGSCVAVCDDGTLSMDNDGTIHIHKIPNHPEFYSEICPGNALTVTGEIKTVEDIVETAMQDEDFYEESGGGITLSGGEPMLQHEFAIELLKEFRKRNVSTAM